jgi:hypothetical protein
LKTPQGTDGVDMQATKNYPTSLLRVLYALLIVFPLLLASPARAYGYADPGTGAFVYQAAYAAFLGGSFYLRKLLDRFFRRKKK